MEPQARRLARAGRAIAANIRPEVLAALTFVPIPPSRPPASPEYDDRMAQVARQIAPNCDVRELIVTQAERATRHTTGEKRDPAALRATLTLVPSLLTNPPRQVVLLDYVLTTGCSFAVCQATLQEALPKAKIFGIFVARRVVDRTSPFEAFIDFES